MLGGWFDRNKCPIGLDLGTHHVRLLQLGRRGDGLVVRAAAGEALSLPASADLEHRLSAMTQTIHRLLDRGGFSGNSVVSCMPVDQLQYKSLRLPHMPMDELRAAVEWEASDRLKIEGGAHLQFFDAGEVRQGDESREEIILMAAPSLALDEHIQLLCRCGLEPVAIDAVPSALTRALGCTPEDLSDDAPAKLILDVGYRCTKVLIARRGRILFFRLIDIGGQKFEHTLMQRLNLSPQDAAELRVNLTRASGDAQGAKPYLFGSTRRESVERAVFEALRPIMGDLVREVGLCLRYYSVTFRGRRPETALLAGGEARNPLLAKVFQEDISIAVMLAQPLINMDCTRPSGLPAGEEPYSEWSIAAGLSLRNIATARKRGAA